MCGFCDISNDANEDINLFTEEEMDRMILGIWLGITNVNDLPVNTYLKIARKLSDGVFTGYGKTFDMVMYGSEDFYMLQALRENVYVFSGAKTYQQVREINSLLTRNRVTGWAEFKKKATVIFQEYNENYLKAEYNSAIAQSRTASQWQEIVRDQDVLPTLTYHTVGDMRVRPTHAELNNITRPVNDKFWDSYMPPNGWNCRCAVLQGDEPKTSLRGFKVPSDVPDIFKFNAGKERIVFSPKHPYFNVAPKDKDNAKQNWGMPMP